MRLLRVAMTSPSKVTWYDITKPPLLENAGPLQDTLRVVAVSTSTATSEALMEAIMHKNMMIIINEDFDLLLLGRTQSEQNHLLIPE